MEGEQIKKMKPKEKAIKYCQEHKLIVPFFSKKINKVFDKALDIAINDSKEQHEKELEDLRMKIIKKIGFDINSLKESK